MFPDRATLLMLSEEEKVTYSLYVFLFYSNFNLFDLIWWSKDGTESPSSANSSRIIVNGSTPRVNSPSARNATPSASSSVATPSANPLLKQHLQIEKPRITSTPSTTRTTKNSLAVSLREAADSLANVSIGSPSRPTSGHTDSVGTERPGSATAEPVIVETNQASEVETLESGKPLDQTDNSTQPFSQNLQVDQDSVASEVVSATRT